MAGAAPPGATRSPQVLKQAQPAKHHGQVGEPVDVMAVHADGDRTVDIFEAVIEEGDLARRERKRFADVQVRRRIGLSQSQLV